MAGEGLHGTWAWCGGRSSSTVSGEVAIRSRASQRGHRCWRRRPSRHASSVYRRSSSTIGRLLRVLSIHHPSSPITNDPYTLSLLGTSPPHQRWGDPKGARLSRLLLLVCWVWCYDLMSDRQSCFIDSVCPTGDGQVLEGEDHAAGARYWWVEHLVPWHCVESVKISFILGASDL